METHRVAWDIPVRHDVDVFVAGGGPGGCAAAVVAARQGRSVFLAEGQSCLGGLGTAGLVPAFMRFGDKQDFHADGFGREILNRLRAAGGTGPGTVGPRAGTEDSNWPGERSLAIRAEVLKRVYDAILQEAGVDFTFHTQLIGVEKESDRVTLAILAAKSGVFAVRARVFIDATGDGDLAAWAGAPFEKGGADGKMMAGTMCSLWSPIDWNAVGAGGLGRGDKRLADAFRDKVFTFEDRHLPGMSRVGETTGGGNIGHTFGVDGTDERSLTEALIWGRKSLLEYERYYKEYLKGFERMELIATGALLGIRETRRILGDYVLSLDDFKRKAVFDDEIGRYSYPIDIHAAAADKASFDKFHEEHTSLRYQTGESYGIPYRILTPRGLSNVLVVGRCVSSDRHIQSSIRVMPGCYITGQAAGMAAAIAIERNADTRGVPIRELQDRLRAIGAFFTQDAGQERG